MKFRKGKNYKVKSVELGLDQLAKMNKDENIKVMSRREGRPSRALVQNKEERTDYVLELKEQILNALDDDARIKQEYRSLTDCLTDIQLIESLPENAAREVNQTAKVIVHLKKDRQNYQEDTNKLDDSVYLRMEQNEEMMPKIIRKLSDDEIYASKMKMEIDHLEGDKGELQFEQSIVNSNHKKNQTISIVSIIVFFTMFMVLLMMQLLLEIDTQVGIVLTGICATIVTMIVFIRYYSNTHNAQKTEHGINRVIDKQNKVKAKYVNAVKGIEYVYAKYQVHSASELLYQWEQYMVTRSARENYQRAGIEIQYNEERLLRELKEYQVKDADIWLDQITYLADWNELKFIKDELIDKRDALKEKLEKNKQKMQKVKDEISVLAIKYPEYAEEISELSRI